MKKKKKKKKIVEQLQISQGCVYIIHHKNYNDWLGTL